MIDSDFTINTVIFESFTKFTYCTHLIARLSKYSINAFILYKKIYVTMCLKYQITEI